MFRKMRRIKQQLDEKLTLEILEKSSSGVLALLGDEGYPYTVPLSYVYSDGKLYFHGAKTGHKVDAIRNCDKASFCVVDKDEVIAEEYTTYFRSVVAFGKIRILEDNAEKQRSVEILAAKYGPGSKETDLKAIEKEFPALCMFEMTIEHVTGKEAIELVRLRNSQ